MNSLENIDCSNNEKEKYIHDYSDEFIRILLCRKAENEAAFFLPYLHQNMNLIDCGCGPGSIEEYSKFVIAMGSAPNFRKQAIAMHLCDQQMLDDLIAE